MPKSKQTMYAARLSGQNLKLTTPRRLKRMLNKAVPLFTKFPTTSAEELPAEGIYEMSDGSVALLHTENPAFGCFLEAVEPVTAVRWYADHMEKWGKIEWDLEGLPRLIRTAAAKLTPVTAFSQN